MVTVSEEDLEEEISRRRGRDGMRHGNGEFARAVKRNKPVKWWHDAIVDDMLTYPLDTLKERSRRLNYTVSYLSVIINSDMFKAHYAHRREEYAKRLDDSLIHKTSQAAGRALDLLLESMETKRTQIPFEKLAEFADKSLSRLGYGNTGNKTTAVQVNVNGPSIAVTQEELAAARNTLRAVESNRANTSRIEDMRPDPYVPDADDGPIIESEGSDA